MTSSTNAFLINLLETLLNYFDLQSFGSRRRTDDMVVGFTITLEISVYYF